MKRRNPPYLHEHESRHGKTVYALAWGNQVDNVNLPHKPTIPENISPTTPLPLELAVRVAFPSGTMTVSGLRNEIRKGNLRASKVAGKIFTTLRDVERMMEQCRITDAADAVRVRNSTCATPSDPVAQDAGSSSTERPTASASSAAQAHLNQIAQRLKKPSANTLPQSTSPTSAKVVPIKS